jgi:hypothetical protein
MHHTLKTYAFLTSALDGSEWSVSIATSAYWVGLGGRRCQYGLLTPKDGTRWLSRNVGKNYHFLSRNNPEERSSQD